MVDFVVEQAVEAQRRGLGELHIGQIIVHIGEDGQLRIELAARFGAEQLDVAHVLFDVQAEAGLYGEHRAVIEADERSGHIFDIEDVVLGNDGGRVAARVFDVAAVAQLVERGPVHAHGLRPAHEIAT